MEPKVWKTIYKNSLWCDENFVVSDLLFSVPINVNIIHDKVFNKKEHNLLLRQEEICLFDSQPVALIK